MNVVCMCINEYLSLIDPVWFEVGVAKPHSSQRMAQPPSPAAKPNSWTSESPVLSLCTGPSAAENTLQKINRLGPMQSKYLIGLGQMKKKGKGESSKVGR